MKKIFKAFVLAATMFSGLTSAIAQDQVEFDMKADVLNKHIWRGQDYGNFSIQPQAEVRWQGLYANLAASTGLEEDDYERLDVQVGYRAPFGLNIGVGTLYRSGFDDQNRFWFFESKKTGHRFEGNIGYTYKGFGIQAYTIFGGNDFKLDGSRAYSTYIELIAPFHIKSVNFLGKIGLTPMESSGYLTTLDNSTLFKSRKDYLYADGFACVLASLRATKDICIGNFKVPVFFEFAANPYTKRAYGVAGLSICPFQKHKDHCKQ